MLFLFVWVTGNFWFLFLIPILVWFFEVLLRRSPLKVVPSLKGGAALSLVIIVLSGVFSLTTGPIRRPLNTPEHYHQDRPNVLIMALEGLRTEKIHEVAPSIAELRRRSIRFEQTYRDAMGAQQSMIAMLGGQQCCGTPGSMLPAEATDA